MHLFFWEVSYKVNIGINIQVHQNQRIDAHHFSSQLCVKFHFNNGESSKDMLFLLDHCQSGSPAHVSVRYWKMIFSFLCIVCSDTQNYLYQTFSETMECAIQFKLLWTTLWLIPETSRADQKSSSRGGAERKSPYHHCGPVATLAPSAHQGSCARVVE